MAEYVCPDWLAQVDPAIDQNFTKATTEYGLTNETVSSLLSSWSKRNLFANRRINMPSIICSVENEAAICVERIQQVEVRTIQSKSEPYVGQTVGSGNSEVPWDKAVFNKFEEGGKTWVRDGSASISSCEECEGAGKIRCIKCSGQGHVASVCPNCKGKGFIEQKGMLAGGSKRGGIAGGLMVTQQQCIRCSASGHLETICDRCNGHGLVDCPSCAGIGKMYKYDVVSAVSSLDRRSIVHCGNSLLKAPWLENASASFNTHQDFERELQPPGFEGSHSQNSRVQNERYNVRIVPFSDATVTLHKEIHLFFVGIDHKLHKYERLLDIRKIVFLVSGFLLLLLLLKIVL